MEKKSNLIAGIKDSVPILLGYLPIGIAYGLLAVKSGLNTVETVLMSILVFAGSSQLICVNMIAAGAAIFPIIMMTFLVNLRHILMSASLSLYFKKTPNKLLPILGFIVTDESFAVTSVNIENYKHRDRYFLGLGVTAYIGWVTSSMLGALIGQVLPITDLPALDFVLPAMFIALLVMQIQRRLDIVVGIISAILSLLFIFVFPGNWNIILATIIAATSGVVIEKCLKDIC